ncbi:MAG: phospho-sugar mutase [Kineosporiaceae bacterium]|nr:phospho-sugar mutase [Aeromicrobium sp.]
MDLQGTDLLERAKAWIEQDPDPVTRSELQELVDTNNLDEIGDRFAGRLQFGTAGLRGALGAGPNRMNRVIVAQAAAGLAAYLLSSTSHNSGESPSVVVGYDARHNSAVFASDTAEIMAGAGVVAHLLPVCLPTPVLAFAIRHLGVSAGVMVTASHNPPQDNGYKVYLADSSQIVPPADSDISDQIDAVGPVHDLPRSQDYIRLGNDVADAYIDAVAALPTGTARDIVAVYTPMHGVGRDTFVEAVKRTGFPPVHIVPAQAEPDPDFPTVAFPNPEEPGAMDLALKLASEVAADIIVANDPDADRCAVGVRDGESYRMLSGDQVGSLLGDFMLRRGITGTYAASIVSSSVLGVQAAAYGQPFVQTLTGFKWIGKISTLAFGYEEALGYSVAPHIARDKDGVSAIIRILELAAELKAEGQTINDRLNDIAREHGLYATGQLTVRVEDLSIIANAMQSLRSTPPTVLGGLTVESFDDLADGFEGLPPTDGIRLGLEGGARIICRPSGTEAKLKCYLEVIVPVHDSITAARAEGQRSLDALKKDLAVALGLTTP